ncbi:MAG: uroporphyrinogen decarboxylase family protein [Eubacteriales bacterium]
MNARERVLNAIQCQEVDRIPWVPFVGCHAAKLIGTDCETYFNSEDMIVEGVKKAFELYRPDGLPTMFDLQLEAEAMGCGLTYAKENPPAVSTHVMEDGAKLEELKIPTEEDGRFPIALGATRRIVEELGDKMAVYGLITGPFTLALHLKGTDIFYDMIDEPEEVEEVMEFCQKVAIQTAKMYIDAGVDIVALVDPMTSQISPSNFEDFVAPYCTAVFDYIHSRGKLGSMFVCGDATRNIEAMCQIHTDNLSVDENCDLQYVVDIARKYNVSVGGNIKLTLTMLFGTPYDNMQDAQECMQIGGHKGFILAPGCDMPYATPEENVLAVTKTVHGDIEDIFKDGDVMDGVEYELPDYAASEKVIIDCITLDSLACAACQYNMEAVYAAATSVIDKVEIIEHKIKEKEGVVCMMKLGATQVPTICVDGVVKYSSILPDNETLAACFAKAVAKKMAK